MVESYGGRIEFLPLFPSSSTSELIRRIREQVGEYEAEGTRVLLDHDGTVIYDIGSREIRNRFG